MMNASPGVMDISRTASSQARQLDSSGGPALVRPNPFAHAGAASLAKEKINTVVVDDHAQLARVVAERIASLIRTRDAEGRNTVLGLATGSTPIGVYRELIRMHRNEGLTFRNVITFNLDEYFPMSADSIHSYHRFMWENLFSYIDIDRANIHIPDGSLSRENVDEKCALYESQIRAVGGIDFQLLGIGKTGHIGFNEPGSGEASRTRLVHLDNLTRMDAAADFFGEENVPREAVTMGIATILEAREIALLATGEHKSAIVRRAVEGEIDRDIAATFLQRHKATVFYLDEAAATDLTRIATPWLVDEVSWSAELELRAVTWLSSKIGKAILKLTQRDYAEHQLSSLVARHGSPGAVNGLVFNALGAKIRGRSKLPANKRIICFSPHPDDDVISMGGILRKLVENGNHVTVAYMTSGNIAVFDHEVRRYLEVLERIESEQDDRTRSMKSLVDTSRASLRDKKPGDVDIVEVQDMKRIIREAEAVSGIEVMGLGRDNAPFSQSPLLSDGESAKGSNRACRRGNRCRPARGGESGYHFRGGRPFRSARDSPDVQGSNRQSG